MKLWYFLVLVLGWLFFEEGTLHAYLDPGSGSMLLQLLLGGFAGLGIIVKLFWHRLRSRVGRPDKDDQPPVG